jgi:hypothetical protein
VILCTLSMLSSLRPQLVQIVPVETLIVDEASQIPIGDYLYAFHAFALTLRRACFIGDDKQRMSDVPLENAAKGIHISPTVVPPFGQDDLKDLRSIFEVEHLQEHILLLNIQCKCVIKN